MFLGACTVTTSETLFFDQVTFTQKESVLSRKKYPFNPDEKAREPLRTSRKVVMIKDSTTEITYSWKERMKRHLKYGKFYLQKTSSDTSNIDVKTDLTSSQYMVSGSFKPPKNAIGFGGHSEKGIVFREDGSCIHSYGTTASDSPLSSVYRRLGEYKVLNDTIYTVYYLGKQQSKSINRTADSTKLLGIDFLPWDVIKPYVVNYVFSTNNDSLYKISGNVSYPYLIATDTLKLLPKNPKLY